MPRRHTEDARHVRIAGVKAAARPSGGYPPPAAVPPMRAPTHASMRPTCGIGAPPPRACARNPRWRRELSSSWKRPSQAPRPPRSPSSAASRCRTPPCAMPRSATGTCSPAPGWKPSTGCSAAPAASAACAAPGAHPAREDWATQATGSATVARRLWSKQPTASILLPTGRTFDAIDVPETAGFLALARMERMELTLGPVTCTPDRRMQFFVLPGAAAKVPDLVRKLGWPPASLDLVALGRGFVRGRAAHAVRGAGRRAVGLPPDSRESVAAGRGGVDLAAGLRVRAGWASVGRRSVWCGCRLRVRRGWSCPAAEPHMCTAPRP